jgi:RNA polymerase sigma factor for flagellar operon FliA
MRTEMENKDINKLWKKYSKKPSDIALRNQLVEHYYPIVKHIAWKMKKKFPKSIQYDEFVSAGAVGLIQSVEHFDLQKGIKFEAYALHRIKGAMLDYVRDISESPRDYYKKKKNNQLEYKDIVTIFHYEDRKYCRKHENNYNKEPCYEIKDFRFNNNIKNYDDQDEMDNIIQKLKPIKQKVLTYYYIDNLTMKQIGKKLNLSESRISQMMTDIMSQLYENQTYHKNQELNTVR